MLLVYGIYIHCCGTFQEEEGEEDEQEVGGAISKTQSSTQPAVKKLRGNKLTIKLLYLYTNI